VTSSSNEIDISTRVMCMYRFHSNKEINFGILDK